MSRQHKFGTILFLLSAVSIQGSAGNPSPADVHDQARLLVQQGRVDQALELELQAEKANPGDCIAHRALSYLFLKGGHTDKAISEAEKATQLNPHDARAWFDLAMANISAGRPDRALAQFQQAYRLDPKNVSAAIGISQSLLGLGRPSEAVAVMEPTSRAFPNDPDSWINLSVAYFKANDINGARKAAAQAMMLSPKSWEATKVAAQIELADFEFQDARKLSARLIALNPQKTYGYLLAARTFYENANDPDQVLLILQKARGNLPRESKLFVQLGESLTVKADKTGPRTLGGNSATQHKWWHLAEMAYGYALQAQPDSIDAHIGLLRLYQKERKFVEAYEQAKIIASLQPNNEEALAAQKNLKFVDNDLAGLVKRQFKKLSGTAS